MAIKGSLREASLAEVCQLLALGLKTGCLSVTDRTRFGQVYFDRGRINFARVGLLTRFEVELASCPREQVADRLFDLHMDVALQLLFSDDAALDEQLTEPLFR